MSQIRLCVIDQKELTHLGLWASHPICVEIRPLVSFLWNQATCLFFEQLIDSFIRRILNWIEKETRTAFFCCCMLFGVVFFFFAFWENAAPKCCLVSMMHFAYGQQVSKRANGDEKSWSTNRAKYFCPFLSDHWPLRRPLSGSLQPVVSNWRLLPSQIRYRKGPTF